MGGGNGVPREPKPARNEGESPMDANANGILGPDPAGGFPNTGRVRSGDVPESVPLTKMKRRRFGYEQQDWAMRNMINHLVQAPFELLKAMMGVRGPRTEGLSGMMGKAGPYGYDPFGAGQAWDPHMGAVSQHTMCRSLLDAWMRKCLAAPGGDGFSSSLSMLQVEEGASGQGGKEKFGDWVHLDISPSEMNPQTGEQGEEEEEEKPAATPIPNLLKKERIESYGGPYGKNGAMGGGGGIMDIAREWRKGQFPDFGGSRGFGGKGDGPRAWGGTPQRQGQLGQQPTAYYKPGYVGDSESCTRMLNDYIYKCDLSLM